MGYSSSDLDMVVWLGCNGVWPKSMYKAPDDRNVFFFFAEEPGELVQAFYDPDPTLRHKDIRSVLDVYGRVRKEMFRARNELKKDGDDNTVFFRQPAL